MANRITGSNTGIGLPAKGTDFNKALFALLKNTHKQIILIDAADTDTEANHLNNQWWQESYRLDDMWLTAPTQDVVDQIRTVCELCAAADIAREEIVKKQIVEIIKQQDSDKKIAIVEGAMHSSTSYVVPEVKGFSVTRQRNWVPDPADVNDLGDAEKFRFNGQAEIVRRMMSFPEKPVTDNELRAIVLNNYFNFYTTRQRRKSQHTKYTLEAGHEDELLQKIDAVITNPAYDYIAKANELIKIFSQSRYVHVNPYGNL